MKKLIRAVNLPRVIAKWLIGDQHHVGHRMIAGLAIMLCGVLIVKSAEGLPHFVTLLIETAGNAVHAVGVIPYLEWLFEKEF